MKDKQKEILEDLECLQEIVDFRKTYHFDSAGEQKRSEIKNWPSFPDFDKYNLVEVVAWLGRIERYATVEHLSLEAVLLLINYTMEEKFRGNFLFATEECNFKTMLEVKTHVVSQLFDHRNLMELLHDVMKGTYMIQTMEDLQEKFTVCFTAIGIASLSFGIKIYMSPYVLFMSLYVALPQSIKQKYTDQLTRSSEPTLKHLQQFLSETVIKTRNKTSAEREVHVVRRDKDQGSSESEKERRKTVKCYCCGNSGHYKVGCPFRKDRCSNCQRRGHTAQVCKSKVIRHRHQRIKGVATETKKKL